MWWKRIRFHRLFKVYRSHLTPQQAWLLPKNTTERKEFFLSHYISLYPVLRSLPTNKAKLPASWPEKKKRGGGGLEGKTGDKEEQEEKNTNPFLLAQHKETFQTTVDVAMTHLEKSMHSNGGQQHKEGPWHPTSLRHESIFNFLDFCLL